MNKTLTTSTIGSFAAKTHLSELLQKVNHGDIFVITVRGKPVAQLQSFQSNTKSPQNSIKMLQQIRSSVVGSVDINKYRKEGRKY